MSVLEYEDKDTQKTLVIQKLEELGYEDYVEELTEKDLFNMVDTIGEMVDAMNNDIEEDEEKLNFLINYIIVLWAEMIVDLGKDSSLL